MSHTGIDYDLWVEHALKSVVLRALGHAENPGLTGEHHFYIGFRTDASGVRIAERLRAQYPKEIVIVLQHQYHNLRVREDGFEVTLYFGGIPEHLVVPVTAITSFSDPSVNMTLQFRQNGFGQEDDGGPAGGTAVAMQPASGNAPSTAASTPPASRVPVAPPSLSDGMANAGQIPEKVVTLDAFRKK